MYDRSLTGTHWWNLRPLETLVETVHGYVMAVFGVFFGLKAKEGRLPFLNRSKHSNPLEHGVGLKEVTKNLSAKELGSG